MIGGERRVSPRVKLITENYLARGGGLVNGGLRLFRSHASLDLGLGAAFDGSGVYLLQSSGWHTRSERDMAPGAYREARHDHDRLHPGRVSNRRNKGVVRGVVVRSRSVISTIGAGLQTLVGGNITLFTQLCERTREDAFQLMLEHARQQGANAVIGIRYDATEVMGGVTEVLCYGTAVVVAAI